MPGRHVDTGWPWNVAAEYLNDIHWEVEGAIGIT